MTRRLAPILWAPIDRRRILSGSTRAFAALWLAGGRANAADTFEAFLQGMWPAAQAAGVSRETFDAAIAGLAPDPSVLAKPRAQAEFTISIPAYLAGAVTNSRVARGGAVAAELASPLARAQARHGVPSEIIVAILGVESNFGTAAGGADALRVLATLAWKGHRAETFVDEFVAALLMLEKGYATRAQLRGSWAGAMGQPQFMPSSYLKYAVDFDGDGDKDIWNSVPDALGSIANYMVQKGWQRGRSWGYEVRIPAKISCAQEGPDLAQPLRAWASLGIARISGKDFPSGELKADSMMLVPAGRHGPEFIVTPNFYVIKEYNNSDLYALFIGNLADRIAYGSGAFDAKWGKVGHMYRSDVQHMQKRLNKMGHDVGKIDGLPGYKTRRSIGRWQEKNGMRPTCYPEEDMLGKL